MDTHAILEEAEGLARDEARRRRVGRAWRMRRNMSSRRVEGMGMCVHIPQAQQCAWMAEGRSEVRTAMNEHAWWPGMKKKETSR